MKLAEIKRAVRARRVAGERRAEASAQELSQFDLANVFVRDAQDRITRWNQGCRRLYGFTAEQAIGRISHDLLQTHFPEPLENIRACLIETGHWEGELVHCAADGHLITVQSEWLLWRSPDGLSIKILEASTDISERKFAEQHLQGEKAFSDAAINSLPGVFVLLNEQNRLIRWNENVSHTTGYSHDEIVRMNALDFIAAEDHPVADAALNQAMTTGEAAAEISIQTKDGRRIPYAFTNRRFQFNGCTGVIAMGLDISQRKRTEAALRESEEKFRTLADNMSQFAWMADETGRIFWYNKRWFEYTGATLAQMEGWGWTKVHHPEHVQRVVDKITRCFQTGEFWEDTFPMRGKDGDYRWFLSRATPIRDAQGKVVRWFGTETDVTELRETQEALYLASKRFETLANMMPQIVWSTTPEGYPDYFNDRWYEFTAMPKKPGLGWTWKEYLHPDDLDRTMEIWQRSLATGEPFEAQYRFRRASDGVYQWFIARALPIRDRRGAISRWFGTCTEVSSFIDAQEALRASETQANARAEELAAFMEAVPAITLVAHDPECQLLTGSRTTCQFFRVPDGANLSKSAPEGQIPTNFKCIKEGRELPPEELPVQKAVITGHEVRDFEMTYVFDDGRSRDIFGNVVPLFDRSGKVRGAVGAFIDITEHKQATERLARTNEQLEQRVRERTAELQQTIEELEGFSYSLTHDMRAPLRAMRGFAEILAEECSGCLVPQRREFLQRISASAERMDKLITDAFQYSLLVRGQFELEPVDTADLLHGILESYPQFQRPHAHIYVENQLPVVLGNKAGLTQCFSNLLTNAIKFVRPGHIPEVHIRADSRPQGTSNQSSRPRVRIWFLDNGIGVEPEYREKIWNMFERLSRGYEGTGIGLALVRKAVERMGGRVGVESQPGQGSQFWIELTSAEPRRTQ